MRFFLIIGIGLIHLSCLKGPEEPLPKKPVYFKDAKERICIYHGLNVSNYSKTAPDCHPWQTREDFARLKAWGFNTVRYLVFWHALEPEKSQYNKTYLAGVLQRMQWLEEFNVAVIIDFHQDLYSPKFGGNGFPDWTADDDGHSFKWQAPWNLNYLAPAVMASYRNFWNNTYLHKRYVHMVEYVLQAVDTLENILGIDVMNEPFPPLPAKLSFKPESIHHLFSQIGLIPEIRDCLAAYETEMLPGFYNRIKEMMEKNRFKTRLFFEPVIYTSAGLPSRLQFIATDRAVYSPHYYDPFVYQKRPYGKIGKKLMQKTFLSRANEAYDFFRTPLFFGEFGIGEAEGFQHYLDDFLDLADKYGASWTYFTYDRGHPFGVLDVAGNETVQLDCLVRIYPQKIAGKNPRWQFKKGKFVLEYETVEMDAPTVIAVPEKFSHAVIKVNGKIMAYDGSLRFKYYNDESERQIVEISWAD
jgi:endoglycosylceramidase